MFLDLVTINLKAGNGGDGAVAWRREKFEPSGGPYGGDGGKGGDIYIVSDNNINTLVDYKYKRHFKAENGQNGRTKKQYGKYGEDLFLKVPVGTMVREKNSNKLLFDLKENGQKILVAKGGRGGRGNAKFANAIHQAPNFSEPGDKGQEISLVLELKLIADVGLIGMPNVGKSSILSILSQAKPKIANYHFTSLEPNLGVVRIDYEKSYVLADIPGLIEGASKGLGLGDDFLKHIERTRILVHVLDMSGSEGRNPIEDFNLINKELSEYNPRLLDKLKIVVANKKDMPNYEENLRLFKEEFPNYKIIETSAITREGLKELKYLISEELDKLEKTDKALDSDDLYSLDDFYKKEENKEINVYKKGDSFYATGDELDSLIRRINFQDMDSLKYMLDRLEEMGVMDRLRYLGIKDGDSIYINEVEMEYVE